MKGLLQTILEKRSDLIKLILGAFLLSISTSLIGNYITNKSPQLIIWISISLAIIVFGYLIFALIKDCNHNISIEALIPIDNEKKRIFPIFRYELSDKLAETLKAVFLENETFKQLWDEEFEQKEKGSKPSIEENGKQEEKEPLKKGKGVQYFSVVKIIDETERPKSKFEKLFEEALEYIFIEQLSTHLSTYFNNADPGNKFLKEYNRNDFPKILLENRIINLLSAPFEDRPVFAKAGMTKNPPPKGEIYYIIGTDGSRYSRFDLVLPNDSTVKRIRDGCLVVENKRIRLELQINYTRFASTTPRGFEYNYLGIEKENLSTRKLDISLKTKIKPLALFSNSGWEYHKWVDSFVDRLNDFCSFEKFLTTIDWESNLTRILITNQREKLRAKKTDKEEKLPPTNVSPKVGQAD